MNLINTKPILLILWQHNLQGLSPGLQASLPVSSQLSLPWFIILVRGHKNCIRCYTCSGTYQGVDSAGPERAIFWRRRELPRTVRRWSSLGRLYDCLSPGSRDSIWASRLHIPRACRGWVWHITYILGIHWNDGEGNDLIFYCKFTWQLSSSYGTRCLPWLSLELCQLMNCWVRFHVLIVMPRNQTRKTNMNMMFHVRLSWLVARLIMWYVASNQLSFSACILSRSCSYVLVRSTFHRRWRRSWRMQKGHGD